MTCLRTFYFIPFILLSFLSLSVLSTSVFARSFDDIIESKKINIAVYNDYPPYSYMEAGSAKGIDVDIAKEIAAKFNVSCTRCAKHIIQLTTITSAPHQSYVNIIHDPETAMKRHKTRRAQCITKLGMCENNDKINNTIYKSTLQPCQKHKTDSIKNNTTKR